MCVYVYQTVSKTCLLILKPFQYTYVLNLYENTKIFVYVHFKILSNYVFFYFNILVFAYFQSKGRERGERTPPRPFSYFE